MINKIFSWLRQYWFVIVGPCFILALYLVAFDGYNTGKNQALKDYKDGIQNHLTWDIKGQCFFVRPNDDVTVYLIRVPDCDRK
jgi:hypothetical protein